MKFLNSIAALGVLTLVACSEEENPLPAGVIYEGGATDEALENLLAGTVTFVADQEVKFTWPVDGDILPTDEPLSFCYAEPEPTARAPRLRPPVDALGRFSPGHDEGRGWGWHDDLPEFSLTPLFMRPTSALAHGTPINGRAYLLKFSSAANASLATVFTTQLDYFPDAIVLQKLHAAEGGVTVELTSAIFEENRVTADGGPFKGGKITIQFRPPN
jgi:hypothetical protein